MLQSKAFLLAIIAYLIWGLSPVYFKSIASLPASEIIVHRIIWSAFFCAIFIFFYKERQWWKPLFKQPKYLFILFFTGLMLSANWLLYVWAINHHYMLEASLGYYINPLLSVLLGTFVLKERMRKLQWCAVGLAFIGVLIQILLMGQLPWISLVLAFSFALYGIIRKVVPIKVLPGMAVETWTLVPVSLLWLWFNPTAMTLTTYFWSSQLIWLCILAGPLTLVPLILFNLAAKHLPYSTIGFLQYMSPTLVFLLAIFYFNEPIVIEKLVTFGVIWLALCMFSFDSYVSKKHGKSNDCEEDI
ncbi:chloramphenicol-sensitive protein RarD [Orbus hercynius]|uniref:Chloramphenicol-sensitive protein RarD n=1 Tax=Orbus hercynius TaxID=593135 RepID=A0A495RK22_9GAMM|nr:EamA family transporter RarD [Orbus hercynius]RKS87650.1 chloramphenicol-sensitive protein RarD [Orbus hercynius]